MISISAVEDEKLFIENINKIVVTNIYTQETPIHGRLLRVSKLFLFKEIKNVSVISVAKDVIVSIRPSTQQMIKDGRAVV
jgi:hypothetical protein